MSTIGSPGCGNTVRGWFGGSRESALEEPDQKTTPPNTPARAPVPATEPSQVESVDAPSWALKDDLEEAREDKPAVESVGVPSWSLKSDETDQPADQSDTVGGPVLVDGGRPRDEHVVRCDPGKPRTRASSARASSTPSQQRPSQQHPSQQHPEPRIRNSGATIVVDHGIPQNRPKTNCSTRVNHSISDRISMTNRCPTWTASSSLTEKEKASSRATTRFPCCARFQSKRSSSVKTWNSSSI